MSGGIVGSFDEGFVDVEGFFMVLFVPEDVVDVGRETGVPDAVPEVVVFDPEEAEVVPEGVAGVGKGSVEGVGRSDVDCPPTVARSCVSTRSRTTTPEFGIVGKFVSGRPSSVMTTDF